MTTGVGSIFSKGLQGININLRGLATAANNISNVNTEGFARQVLQTGSSGFSSNIEIGITSIVNPFVELQLFQTANEFGTLDGRRRTIGQLEAVFDESNTNGLGQSMSEFFNAWSELSSDPSSAALRQDVRERAVLLGQKFASLSDQINNMRRSLSSEMETRVQTINSLTSEIAGLNSSIAQATDQGVIQELQTRRSFVVRQLSEEVGISTYYSNNGDLQVQLENGANLVNGFSSGTISLTDDLGPGGTISVSASLPGSGETFDVTTGLTSGRLGGNLTDRNTTLNDKISEIDELAYNFVNEINNIHNTAYGLNGNTGLDFFAPIADQDGAADAVSVDALILADLENIGAAQSDPNATGTVGDNRKALEIFNLQTSLTMNGSSETFSEYYQGLIGDVGVTAGNINRAIESQTNLLTQMELQRESVSGVNLDEEAASLIQYQRAFQASARLVAAADEILTSLLEL